jgi:hypothetical protein
MSGVSIHPDQNHVIQGRFPVVAPLIQQLTRFAWLLQRGASKVRGEVAPIDATSTAKRVPAGKRGTSTLDPPTPHPLPAVPSRPGVVLSLYPPLTSDGWFTRKNFFLVRAWRKIK